MPARPSALVEAAIEAEEEPALAREEVDLAECVRPHALDDVQHEGDERRRERQAEVVVRRAAGADAAGDRLDDGVRQLALPEGAPAGGPLGHLERETPLPLPSILHVHDHDPEAARRLDVGVEIVPDEHEIVGRDALVLEEVREEAPRRLPPAVIAGDVAGGEVRADPEAVEEAADVRCGEVHVRDEDEPLPRRGERGDELVDPGGQCLGLPLERELGGDRLGHEVGAGRRHLREPALDELPERELAVLPVAQALLVERALEGRAPRPERAPLVPSTEALRQHDRDAVLHRLGLDPAADERVEDVETDDPPPRRGALERATQPGEVAADHPSARHGSAFASAGRGGPGGRGSGGGAASPRPRAVRIASIVRDAACPVPVSTRASRPVHARYAGSERRARTRAGRTDARCTARLSCSPGKGTSGSRPRWSARPAVVEIVARAPGEERDRRLAPALAHGMPPLAAAAAGGASWAKRSSQRRAGAKRSASS